MCVMPIMPWTPRALSRTIRAPRPSSIGSRSTLGVPRSSSSPATGARVVVCASAMFTHSTRSTRTRLPPAVPEVGSGRGAPAGLLVPVIPHHPNGPLAHLRRERVPRRARHRSSRSGVGGSDRPGAVHTGHGRTRSCTAATGTACMGCPSAGSSSAPCRGSAATATRARLRATLPHHRRLRPHAMIRIIWPRLAAVPAA